MPLRLGTMRLRQTHAHVTSESHTKSELAPVRSRRGDHTLMPWVSHSGPPSANPTSHTLPLTVTPLHLICGVFSADGVGGYGASTFGVDVPVPTNPIVLARNSALFLHVGGVPPMSALLYPAHSQTFPALTKAMYGWAPASTKATRGWDQSPTKTVYGRSYTPTKTPQIRCNGVTVSGNMWDVGLALGGPLCDTHSMSVRALCDPRGESTQGRAQIWCGSRSLHGRESAATALCRVATACGAESWLIQTNP
ncbi:hypothetical protein B0H14DRAFT_2644177 [Mycena olivaceomarginata]|nr:hypothetical protein B0H14DRAFT_2644177 [Mycena olivaceomarginata]